MSGFVSTPHLPVGEVGVVAAGERYKGLLSPAFEKLNIDVLWLPDALQVDSRLAGHADLSLMHLGKNRVVSAYGENVDSRLEMFEFEVIRAPRPGASYPHDCILNACIVGKKLFHRLDVTAKEVLDNLADIEPVPVSQGYAKCCTCVVDAGSIITSDHGIALAAKNNGIDVLEISPGYIGLEGFNYGFIGGASFKLSGTCLAFTGRMDMHPDWRRIEAFLSEREIVAVFLTDGPAFDIGSVLPLIER